MKKIIIIFLFLFAGLAAYGQHMFDYSDIKAGRFRPKTVSGVRSMNDGEHYTAVKEGRIEKYGYADGESKGVVFDMADHAGIGEFFNYTFSPDEKKILIATAMKPVYRHSYTADHWVYDIAASQITKLTDDGGEQVPEFSPDARRVAFVRGNDIYYVDLSDHALHRVTRDGEVNRIINGHTDWVYEEEFAFTRAFSFSPDGSRLSYLKFDESMVPQFTMMIYGDGLYPVPYTYKYPKAGDRNAAVELFVYDIPTESVRKMDTGPETDQYIPRIGWTPEGAVWFYRTNRLQNHFELLLGDASTGSAEVIYDERDRRYVERLDDETVTFLPKNRFIVKNETSGYAHLYLHTIGKGLTDTLTRGNWEVTQVVEVTSDRVYYMSTEGSPLRRSLHSVKLNSKGKTDLTEHDGVYNIMPSKGFRYFISYFSNVATPLLVRLHDSKGKVLRVLEDNSQLRQNIEARRVPAKEFFRFTTVSGQSLNGYIVKPYGFDPAKKYPVLLSQYSGPGSQQVLDRWSMDWTDVLVQEDYIVVCVDGRGTGGRGAEFRKCTYGNLGGLETTDQIEAAKYMATQSYVDPERIGIYGWSYGGFMALNCILKGNDVFKTAVAVAPVTSWRFYDSIYTEIYNGLPADNPRGYDENSPINFAGNLKGDLLIVHGTADDNVHVQNTYRMADALVKAGKQFDMMIYPDDNHGMVPGGRHHVMELMIDYVLKNL